jgi:hypothetical protein
MDVAEDIGNSGLVENNIARASGFIQAKIKALAFEQRKHVVKKRIPVRKLHHGPHGHNQDMRVEALILLN